MTTADAGPSSDAWHECVQVTNSIGDKADKNKKRARRSTIAMTACSAMVPVTLAALPDGSIQKALASLLAAAVVVIGSWVQIEKPQERWVLYRRYHRMLEADQLNYRFENAPYDDPAENDRRLAATVAQRQLDLHEQWEGIVPSSGDARRLAQGGGSQ